MMSINSNVPLLALLLLLLVGPSQGIKVTLEASTSTIPIEGALNFSLNCSVVEDPSEEPSISEVYRLAITKFENKLWTPVVSMDSSWETPLSQGELLVTAAFTLNGHNSIASVSVTYLNATVENSGHFDCEVIGYDRSGRSSVQLSAPVRVEAEVQLTLYEVVKMMRSFGDTQKDILDTQKDTIDKQNSIIDTQNDTIDKQNSILDTQKDAINTQKDIVSDIDTMKRLLNENIDAKENFTERLSDAMRNIAVLGELYDSSEADKRTDIDALKIKVDAYKMFENIDIDALVTNVSLNQQTLESLVSRRQLWSEGAYSLLQPATGCPENEGVNWETGFRKTHTESTSENYDRVSLVMHMKKPVMEKVGSNHFMTQHFCTVPTPSGSGPWPAGTYCIMKTVDYSCPGGFQEGLIVIDDEDTRWNVGIGGTTPVFEHNSGLFKINYCCRKDSNPSNGIYLPTAKPFYLHRYQGVCQKVVGMRVSGEFLYFTPEVKDDDSLYRDAHPDDDSYLPHVRLELCYYERI